MRKILRVFVVAQFIGLICLINQATTFASGGGSSSGITLLQPTSARIASLGEACVSLNGDIAILSYNPSGIASLENIDISLLYQRGFNKDNFMGVLFGKSFSAFVLGTSLLYYDTGKIDLYTSAGNLVSKTGQKDIILILTFATKNKRIPVGLSLKGIQSEIFGENASAFAGDLGAQYIISEEINTGLSIQNFGTKLKYVERGDNLPQVIRAGISYESRWFSLKKRSMLSFSRKKGLDKGKFLISLDFPYFLNEKEQLLLSGIEFRYGKFFSLRMGYKKNLTNSGNEDENLTFGFGVNYQNYSFDYSIGITGDLDTPHRVSLSVKFL